MAIILGILLGLFFGYICTQFRPLRPETGGLLILAFFPNVLGGVMLLSALFTYEILSILQAQPVGHTCTNWMQQVAVLNYGRLYDTLDVKQYFPIIGTVWIAFGSLEVVLPMIAVYVSLDFLYHLFRAPNETGLGRWYGILVLLVAALGFLAATQQVPVFVAFACLMQMGPKTATSPIEDGTGFDEAYGFEANNLKYSKKFESFGYLILIIFLLSGSGQSIISSSLNDVGMKIEHLVPVMIVFGVLLVLFSLGLQYLFIRQEESKARRLLEFLYNRFHAVPSVSPYVVYGMTAAGVVVQLHDMMSPLSILFTVISVAAAYARYKFQVLLTENRNVIKEEDLDANENEPQYKVTCRVGYYFLQVDPHFLVKYFILGVFVHIAIRSLPALVG